MMAEQNTSRFEPEPMAVERCYDAMIIAPSPSCPAQNAIFNLQSLIPEKGVSRIGYAFGHNCKSIV